MNEHKLKSENLKNAGAAIRAVTYALAIVGAVRTCACSGAMVKEGERNNHLACQDLRQLTRA